MASNTRTVTGLGAVFDFVTERRGSVTFFSNDLNINFGMTLQAPSILLTVHLGPIVALTTIQVGANVRVTLSARSIGSGFAPPPLSLVQLQTDTVTQSPAATLSPIRTLNLGNSSGAPILKSTSRNTGRRR